MHSEDSDAARLKDDAALERSEVVANGAMNRERGIVGANSYTKDLGFDVLGFLVERLPTGRHVRWLDLCCGTGKALSEAALALHNLNLDERCDLVGVDLVPMFVRSDSLLPCVRLYEASVNGWRATGEFDLITCVHGLHYVGDKLGLVARAASWLTTDGRFLAHLDYRNIRLLGAAQRPSVWQALAAAGFVYNRHKRLLSCTGRRNIALPFAYQGADDAAGPNYTGQPAVTSVYARV